MSNKLTWADVAHYYAANHPIPNVVLPCGRILKDEPFYRVWMKQERKNLEGLPILRDLSQITEEDAKAVLGFANYYTDDQDCRELFLQHRTEEGDMMIWKSIVGCPAALHYLISRNYNVFGIETYKGGVE